MNIKLLIFILALLFNAADAQSVNYFHLDWKLDILAGTNQGLLYSQDDCQSWAFVGDSSYLGRYNPIGAINSSKGGYTYAFRGYSLYRSNDPAYEQWEPCPLPTGIEASSIAINSQKEIYCGSFWSGVWKSIDFGKTFVSMNENIPITSNLTALTVDKFNNVFFGGFYRDGGIYYSEDGGENWGRLDRDMGYSVNRIEFTLRNEILIGVEYGGILQCNNLNGGFRKLNSDIDFDHAYSICLDSNENIFVGTNNGIYRSQDGGMSWQQRNNGLILNTYFRTLEYSSKGYLLAGNRGAIFISYDLGDNWQRVMWQPAGTIPVFKIQPIARNVYKNYYDVFGRKVLIRSGLSSGIYFKIGLGTSIKFRR